MAEHNTPQWEGKEKAPRDKVVAGGVAGAAVTVIMWALSEFASVEIPPEVAAAAVTVISFAAAYLKRELH